ncbi:MAG TPA: glycosyltransferase family 1 protein [Thermoanaerobaculia bacterium]|nr:glycosyltransferase family 1 protein [Thermoanaerobaculia bacterium]
MTSVLIDARKARDFGIGRYLLGLLRALSRRGEFRLSAVVFRDDAALLPAGVTPVVSGAGRYTAGELVAVRSAIARVKPDLFHAPHYVVPFFPPPSTVVTIHDLMHLSRPEHGSLPKRAYATWMIHRAVRLSSRVITVSDAVRREVAGAFPEASAKLVVIPNGVGPEFRGARPAGEGAPYLLFLGNDKLHKNLDGLLSAFAILRGARPALRLLLAGVPPGRRAAPRVEALGFVPDADLPSLVAGARALVLPSFAEGFGLPVLEAQAAGTPVACSDLPALREASGGEAVFFDPHAPESIARAVGGLLDDAAAQARLREAGFVRAAAFTWDRTAERTSAVYRDVLGR